MLFFLLVAAGVSQAGEIPSQPRGWTTTEKDGVRWFVTPEGNPFYSKGVNIVNGGKESALSLRKQEYYWNNFFPSADDWRKAAGGQLALWGFNTRGGWSDPSPVLGLSLTVDLELGRNSQFHWFDPFDPSMEKQTLEQARELTAPFRNAPNLIGYFSDNEVGWWNSPLFRWYLKAGWDNHTKQVLWQLLYDHYKGNWESFLADWVPANGLHNFEDLKRQGAALQLRPGGDGIHVVDRFTYLIAGRYYQLMHDAIRKAHPEALVLGDRLPLYYHQDALLAMGDYVDVISTNYNIDTADGWVAPYFFEGMRRLNDKPVLVTEFFFAAQENRSGNRNETARNKYPKPGHLMTVTTQAERAWGAGNALVNFARFPNVVGAHWFQYCDEPMGGRQDGEDYNMGLIDTANRPYEEVTEAFMKLNPVLDTVHRTAGGEDRSTALKTPVQAASGTGPDSLRRVGIPRATSPIDVTDQSLVDWDKKNTRLTGFQTQKPYVPFGDVHVTWTPRGLYVASLANTFVEPEFLAHTGDFPRSESFRMVLNLEVHGRTYSFTVYLIPKSDPDLPDGFAVWPELFRSVDGKPAERLPVEGRVQRLNKALPHMTVEAFFPADSLGMKELQPGMELGMNVTLVSYYREFIMTWTGEPTLENLDNPASMRPVTLKDGTSIRFAR